MHMQVELQAFMEFFLARVRDSSVWRLGFAEFLRTAPRETFSGSIHNRKSRAHVRIIGDYLMTRPIFCTRGSESFHMASSTSEVEGWGKRQVWGAGGR